MKKFILAAAIAVCILALPGKAYASDVQEDGQRIEFLQNENQIDVTLTSQAAAREEISSLQLSLKVEAVGDAKIQFTPNSNLPAKIVESRYHEDTGILNIYVAGGEALFDKSSYICSLGSVVINNKDASVTVTAVENSLKYVRGTELVSQEKDVEYPEPANYPIKDDPAPGGNDGNNAGNGSGSGNGQGTGSGNEPGPGNTGADAGSGGGTGSSGSGTGTGSSGGRNKGTGNRGNKGNNGVGEADSTQETVATMLDEFRLREALERAAEYDPADYTEESYRLLLEAVSKAEELLSNPDATQEELDEAQLVIENAIGMLELKSDGPVVEPEGSEEELESGITETQETGASQKTSSIRVPVIIGIVVAVILIAAVIAGIVVLLRKR